MTNSAIKNITAGASGPDSASLARQISTLSKQVAELKEMIRKGLFREATEILMRPVEVASYLKISRRQLDLIKDRDEITYHKYGQSIWYKKSDVDKRLLTCRVPALEDHK